MIIIRLVRSYGLGLGFFGVMLLLLLFGNEVENTMNWLKYDTQWEESMPIYLKVGESREVLVRTKDEEGINVRFLQKKDFPYLIIKEIKYEKSQGRWHYYKVTLIGERNPPKEYGFWLFAVSKSANNPTLGHGEDWVKILVTE